MAELGVNCEVLNKLTDWSKDAWPKGDWDKFRSGFKVNGECPDYTFVVPVVETLDFKQAPDLYPQTLRAYQLNGKFLKIFIPNSNEDWEELGAQIQRQSLYLHRTDTKYNHTLFQKMSYQLGEGYGS